MIDHEWAQENLDAYLAGGLSDAERTALEQHVADCAECAQSLKSARKLETIMKDLFADAPPAAGLEERAIARLRLSPTPHPFWRRYLVGAAAAVLLGLIGSIVQAIADDGGKKFADFFEGRNSNSTFTTVGSKIGSAGGGKYNQEGKPTAEDETVVEEKSIDKKYVKGKLEKGIWNETVDIMDRSEDRKESAFRSGLGTGTMAGYLLRDGRGGETHELSPEIEIVSGAKSVPEEELLPEIGGRKNSPAYFEAGGGKKPESRIAPPAVVKPARPINDPALQNQEGFLAKVEEQAKKEEPAQPKDGPPPPPLPEPAGRKIIRTGEIEFEVESFDGAVAGIGRLIATVKGGFVTTNNSNKQTNGKMRGAVVVRMPPESLEKFTFDLRGAVGKNAELKHQRIGSQDVTGQFTDTESELRTARAMELRFLDIIKNGKGAIKDLIAAENALGEWRTKIEKMESQMRTMNNQIALSTLTINLTERDFSTPFALVTSEKVQMRIEVEEVGKALEAALKAVDQFNGRVVKSESKQHKAGQIEASLHAELPAAAKESFRNAVRKLGLVSEDESTQKTQAEGGSGKPGKLEPKVNDVVFDVTLNNIVNIPPRNSANIDVASSDVAGNYARLEAFVNKKGQMRVASKSGSDPARVAAYLEFNVPNENKEEADKLIAAAGPVLKQTSVQAPITEFATDQKFGYKLNLYSVGVIAPRETVKLTIQVDDVAVRAAEIEDLGKLSKGQVERGRFLQSPQGTTTMVVALRVPMTVADTLVNRCMKMSKQVIEREQTPNPNVPENDLATTAVIVTLTGGNPLIPSDEGVGKQISSGLYWAFWIFSKCLMFILIGLAFLLPWTIVIWVGIKVGSWILGSSPTSTVVVKPVAPVMPKVEAVPKPESGEQKPAN